MEEKRKQKTGQTEEQGIFVSRVCCLLSSAVTVVGLNLASELFVRRYMAEYNNQKCCYKTTLVYVYM